MELNPFFCIKNAYMEIIFLSETKFDRMEIVMKKFEYVITDEQGIHARPAGELVKVAKKFESDIQIEKDGRIGDAKKIFSVMGLAAKKGQKLTITCSGIDEETAVFEMEKFMKENM